jgi:hypothetical protein
MKNEKLILLVLCSLSWIACAAPQAGAQQDRNSIIRKKATTTTPTAVESQQKRETQVADTSKIINEPPIEPNSIRVRIRYQKEYGYITTKSFNDDGPYSCNAFTIDAGVWAGEAGIGRPKTGNELDVLMTITSPVSMRVNGGYYVRDFTITSVPLNEPIIVKASMVSNPKILTTRWRAGSQPQPPPGSERMILNGSSKLRLTKSDPTASVDFEMVYRPIQLPPR